MSTSKSNFWSSPLTKSRITSDDVKMPEMLLGYFIGPFGALLSSGIFTSILQNYFTDVLKLDLGFLTTLQLVSTVLIVASNLIVGQLIEHTKALAGKARPWILLSALTLSVASVLMFIVPFEGMAKMVWIAIAYNLYYAVAYPIYNTANSTMIPVSTRDSKQRGALASFTNVAGLGVMGCGSMVFPMLVSFALKEDQHLWFLTMLAVAIFSALTIYLQFLFTRERVTEEGRADTETPAKSATLGEQLKAVTGDRMWWIVMAFYMLFQWSGAMKNGSMSYFCKWVLDNTFFGTADAWGASQGLLSIMGAIPMAVAAVFVVPLANKFGKRLVCGGFMLLALNARHGAADGQASMGMMVAGLAMMGFAELFIDPVAMAQITRLNMPGVTGVLTGIYMLATGAVANWLAGVVAQQTTESQISDTAIAAYQHFFAQMGEWTLGCVAVMVIIAFAAACSVGKRRAAAGEITGGGA